MKEDKGLAKCLTELLPYLLTCCSQLFPNSQTSSQVYRSTAVESSRVQSFPHLSFHKVPERYPLKAIQLFLKIFHLETNKEKSNKC